MGGARSEGKAERNKGARPQAGLREAARGWGRQREGRCKDRIEWGEGGEGLLIEGRDHSVQFSSVAQSCPTLCDPMNRSTPDLPVHHQLPEFTQIHVHRISDAMQLSHPLSSPSPPAPNPSQHQSLFQ